VRGRVGSDWGALTLLQALRFPSPPSEPDVRVSTHPALHEFVPSGYAADAARLAHGVSMLAAR
jgi:hypothetical protein